jgi:uncharacterized membrane protein YvbJ
MGGFDEQQLREIRQIVRDERRSTDWRRVLFWIGVAVVALIVLVYLASSTLQSEGA